MKKIVFVLLCALNITLIAQNTQKNAIIISNKDYDIEHFEHGKLVKLHLNGIPHSDLDQFSKELNAIKGITVKHASIIPNKKGLSKIHVFLSNDFDKGALNNLLSQYNIKDFIINGKYKTFTDLFATKKEGIIIYH